MVISGELVIEIGGGRFDVKLGELGTMVELNGNGGTLSFGRVPLLEHEGERGKPGGIALEDDLNGGSEFVSSVVIEKKQKPGDDSSRGFPLFESLLEEEMSLGQQCLESAEAERCLSLFPEFEKRLSVLGSFQDLPAVEAPAMGGNDGGAVEDAHLDVGGGEGKSLSHGVGGNGVLVEVEADVDGLGRRDGLEQLHVESVFWQSEETALFVAKDIEDGERLFFGMGSVKNLVPPLEGFSIEVGEVGELPAVEEPLADESDGPLDATFLIASAG
jgi:hypothetical protein